MKNNQLHINAFEIHLSQEARIHAFNIRTEQLQFTIQTCEKYGGTISKTSNVFKNWMYKLISWPNCPSSTNKTLLKVIIFNLLGGRH
jgi:hypothetical protein